MQISPSPVAALRPAAATPASEPGAPVSAPGAPSPTLADAARAAQLVRASVDVIAGIPQQDRGSEATKQARLSAFALNKDAQALLEQHFEGAEPALVSTLRTADASLEDAAWQLAKKPSPDGRFQGVDIPGALADTQAALAILEQLAAPATPPATPSTPTTPAPSNPWIEGPQPGDVDYCETPGFPGSPGFPGRW